MARGIFTVARDVLRPLLFGEWNTDKQVGSESTSAGQLGWINVETPGLNRTMVTPSSYVSQIAANKGPVHAALSLVAKKVGATPLRIFRPKRQGRKSVFYVTRTRAVPEPRRTEMLSKAAPGSVLSLADDVEEIVAGHRLIDLLMTVNAHYDAYQLKNVTAAYLGLTGNCYWVLLKDGLGIPTAIWVAPAEHMRVKPDQDTLVAGYVYKHGKLKREFAVDDVVHFKTPAPGAQFQFYGRGDLMGAMDDFNLLQYMYQFEEALFLNGGIPATMLSVSGNWSEEEKTSFREQYLQRFGGPKKAGKPMVGENVKVETLGLSPREMAYQSARKFSNTNIYSNMGAPEAMMTGQVTTRAALDASLTQMAIFTIEPMLMLIQQALNAQLVPRYKDPIYVEFDNVIPEDKEFQLKEDTEFVEAGIAAINEIRQKRGLPPQEGGDVPYQSMTRVPLGTEVSRQPTQMQISDMASKALEEAQSRIRGNGDNASSD